MVNNNEEKEKYPKGNFSKNSKITILNQRILFIKLSTWLRLHSGAGFCVLVGGRVRGNVFWGFICLCGRVLGRNRIKIFLDCRWRLLVSSKSGGREEKLKVRAWQTSKCHYCHTRKNNGHKAAPQYHESLTRGYPLGARVFVIECHFMMLCVVLLDRCRPGSHDSCCQLWTSRWGDSNDADLIGYVCLWRLRARCWELLRVTDGERGLCSR